MLLSPRKLDTKIVVDKVVLHAIQVITLSTTKPVVVSCLRLGAAWILSARTISVPLYAQNSRLIFLFCRYNVVDYPYRIISAGHNPSHSKANCVSRNLCWPPSDAIPPSFCAITSCEQSLISVKNGGRKLCFIRSEFAPRLRTLVQYYLE